MRKLVLLGVVGAFFAAACASTEGEEALQATVSASSTTVAATQQTTPTENPPGTATPSETTIGTEQGEKEGTVVTTTAGDGGSLEPTGTVPEATALPSSTTNPPKGTASPTNPLVTSAVADLAARLNIDAGSIVVVGIESVVWPDGSLGCPQPGMSYTQVQVDGSRILLAVGTTEYEYHSGGTRAPFLCTKG